MSFQFETFRTGFNKNAIQCIGKFSCILMQGGSDLFPHNRKQTKTVYVRNIPVGGKHPISVQSMTKTKTEDWAGTIDQIQAYQEAGCEIVRCTVNTPEAAKSMVKIRQAVKIPLVADIHFDYKLALASIDAGIDKIRINPGNIGNRDKITQVVSACANKGIPIRIGVNSGSLEKDILQKHQYPTSDAMVESALRHIGILEDLDFQNIIISLKSSNVWMMIEAYRKLSNITDHPLHLGVTEAGPPSKGNIWSSVGIGTLLAEGIGDTIRVSLTGDGREEIRVAKEILRCLGLASFGINIVSCPTCGRLEADLVKAVEGIEKKTASLKKNLTIAVMGCVVNGPGEARGADIGVSLGKDHAVLYVKGESRGMIPIESVEERLLKEIELYNDENSQ